MTLEEYNNLRTGDFVYYTPINEDDETYEYPQIKKGVFMCNLYGKTAAIKPIEENPDRPDSCDVICMSCIHKTEESINKFIKEVLADRIYLMEEKIEELSRKIEEYKMKKYDTEGI